MRDRQRLIEVLQSVNTHVHAVEANVFRELVEDFLNDRLTMYFIVDTVRDWAFCHGSPHIRDLSRDAMQYISRRAAELY